MLHKDLEVYKSSLLLVKRIYELSRTFPKEEMYGLVSQLRRAAISIPSNIAEGAARRTNNELIQFLYIALGSTSELETQIDIAHILDYISEEQAKSVTIDLIRIRKMLSKLNQSLKNPLTDN